MGLSVSIARGWGVGGGSWGRSVRIVRRCMRVFGSVWVLAAGRWCGLYAIFVVRWLLRLVVAPAVYAVGVGSSCFDMYGRLGSWLGWVSAFARRRWPVPWPLGEVRLRSVVVSVCPFGALAVWWGRCFVLGGVSSRMGFCVLLL